MMNNEVIEYWEDGEANRERKWNTKERNIKEIESTCSSTVGNSVVAFDFLFDEPLVDGAV